MSAKRRLIAAGMKVRIAPKAPQAALKIYAPYVAARKAGTVIGKAMTDGCWRIAFHSANPFARPRILAVEESTLARCPERVPATRDPAQRTFRRAVEGEPVGRLVSMVV